MRFLKIIGEYRLFIKISLTVLFNYCQPIIFLLFSCQMTHDKIGERDLSHEAFDFERSKSSYVNTGDRNHDSLGDLNCCMDNRGG